MKENIKELRVKVDGLAQLTKGLKPKGDYIIDMNKIDNLPDNMTPAEALTLWEEKGIGFKDFIEPVKPFKEIEKAVDSLYLAKAWLGKVLGELGYENPYGSGYKTKEDIKPTADTANKVKDFPLDSKEWADDIKNISYIEKVDWLRQEIDQIVLKVKHLDDNMTDHKHQRPTREFAIARTNSYNHLCEARFWLGFELQKIKETKDEKA